MTDQETLEGNKLIAEFMQIQNVFEFSPKQYPNKKILYVATDEDGGIDFDSGFNFIEYNTSWNLLMPVVEKIESLGYCFKICRKRIAIYLDEKVTPFPLFICKEETKINSVFVAAMKFIKWYNENKQIVDAFDDGVSSEINHGAICDSEQYYNNLINKEK